MNTKTKAAAVLLTLACTVGCAQPPDELVETLKKEHPNEYETIVAPELKKQEEKSAIFRSYNRTRELIDAVNAGAKIPPETETSNGVSVKYMGDGVTCYVVYGHQAVGISCLKKQ